MKESDYLERRIVLLWTLNKITRSAAPRISQEKLSLVTGKLVKFAQEKNLPLRLILYEYAYFFSYIAKEVSFNKIYTRLSEFIDHYTPPAAAITEEDVDFAEEVEEGWNAMHAMTAKDLPFTLRTVLLKSGIKIKVNTFFKHEHKFQDFCTIANFVRRNRRIYPQIHGMREFFIHLPIIWKRPAEYIVFQYLDPEKTLDKYYRKIYGETPRQDRFPRFLELMQGNDALKGFEDVWGVTELAPATGDKK